MMAIKHLTLRRNLYSNIILLSIISIAFGVFLILPLVTQVLNIDLKPFSEMKEFVDIQRKDIIKSSIITLGYFLILFGIGLIIGDKHGYLTAPELRKYYIISLVIGAIGLNYFGHFLPVDINFPILNGIIHATDLIGISLGLLVGIYFGCRWG